MASPPHKHLLSDISNSRDLIRYAVASHLGRLEERGELKVKKESIAAVIGMSGQGLSHALGSGTERFSDAQLRRFDLAMTVLGLEHAGGLSALAVRLRGAQDQTNLVDAHTPASTHRELLGRLAGDEDTVLLQADALTAQLRVASDLHKPVHRQRREAIEQLVSRLILIGAAPPTQRNVEALIWLGTLSGHAFDLMAEQLEQTVRTAPLGFRVWRAVTKSVLLNTAKSAHADKAAINALRDCVQRLLEDAETLRLNSLYPGRSLDLELALAVPGEWTAPAGPQDTEYDWVGQVLLRRARNPEATLRERGTAAHGLWQRAVLGRGRSRDAARQQLDALIEEYGKSDDRRDIATGLRWTAATLRAVIDRGVEVCNEWPENEEPWFHRVMAAAARLEANVTIPEHVRPATRKLFEHALLQNAGVSRRQAIDTLVAAGWAEQIANALIDVLAQEDESWLRIRALFALGFLQCRSMKVEHALVSACVRADGNLSECERPSENQAVVTELHAALFSVGDCFGARGAERQARAVRERLRPVLENLVSTGRLAARETWPVARAVAYLLTVSAQSRRGGQDDLAQVLLRELADHPDDVTRKLSEWALSFRFDDRRGVVRPLLAAAQLDSDGNFPDDRS